MFAPYMYFLITKFFMYYDNMPRPPHNRTTNGHHHQLCDKGGTKNAKKKSPRDVDDGSWATDKFSFIFLFIFFLMVLLY